MWRPGWRAKALLQHVLSRVPCGDAANYAFQRKVTHSYPVSETSLADDLELGRHHVEVLRRHGSAPIEHARFFEFGAGWDLAMPLVLRSAGVARQLVIDIRSLVRPELVADVARRLGVTAAHDAEADLAAFLADCGIEYRAPCDARDTGEPAGSIDYITSTNTLEHIPIDAVSAILDECHRMLAPCGVMSFQVDYKDHYSYFDRSIPAHHFLRYSPARWRLYNPPLHHQNRLRHDDYLRLYAAAGFEVVEADVTPASDRDLAALARTGIHPSFGDHPVADLAVRESRVVLMKAGEHGR